ncbi:hypothetical protein KKF84_13555 [Myxococcota bacterium]|nr:hypothetical protein [Myxococcota bacterium]MBU1536346.1 hypothetical protein [Myxococcota bacterium]
MAIYFTELHNVSAKNLADNNGLIPQRGDASDLFDYPSSSPWLTATSTIDQIIAWYEHMHRCSMAILKAQQSTPKGALISGCLQLNTIMDSEAA